MREELQEVDQMEELGMRSAACKRVWQEHARRTRRMLTDDFYEAWRRQGLVITYKIAMRMAGAGWGARRRSIATRHELRG